MTSPTDDRDLEDYLAGGSEISRRYKEMSQEQPTRTLDRAVLIEARTAGGAPAKVTPVRPHRARWMVPFAAAATVLLSFAIFKDAGMNSHAPAYVPVAPLAERETTVTITAQEAPAPELAIAAPDAPEAPRAATARKDAAAPAGAPASAAQTNDLASVAAAQDALRRSSGEAPPAVELDAAPPAPAVQEMIVTDAEKKAFARSRGLVSKPAAEETLAGIRRQLDAGNKEEARDAFKTFLRVNPDYFKQHPEIAKTFSEFADLLK